MCGKNCETNVLAVGQLRIDYSRKTLRPESNQWLTVQVDPLSPIASVRKRLEPAYVIRNISFTDTQVFCAPGMRMV
jgi:hypothetical protein